MPLSFNVGFHDPHMMIYLRSAMSYFVTIPLIDIPASISEIISLRFFSSDMRTHRLIAGGLFPGFYRQHVKTILDFGSTLSIINDEGFLLPE